VTVTPFGDRLGETFDRVGHLCVGIDPHSWLLERWGLDDSAAGVREFGLRVVEAAWNRAGIVKPQVAFFERHGSRGYEALERVLAEARAAGLIVIADAKRGDVGTSVEAYGQAWLTPGSPLEADAMTISAYQGVGSIAAPLALAAATGKGMFVLAATSNPEAAAIQRAVITEGSQSEIRVAAAITAGVAAWNQSQPDARFGSAGVVLGATLDLRSFGFDIDAEQFGPTMPVLAPGFGAQGASVAETRRIYGVLTPGVIVSESRTILEAGPEGVADAIARRSEEVETHRG
jgi:orotidine-5'-phosphate decarboxylase